jgi:predicted membrane channel-forming protein YqfA (hemolysin III family)
MWMFCLVFVAAIAAIVVGVLIVRDPVNASRRVFQFVVLGCILLFVGWEMSKSDVAPEQTTVQGQR